MNTIDKHIRVNSLHKIKGNKRGVISSSFSSWSSLYLLHLSITFFFWWLKSDLGIRVSYWKPFHYIYILYICFFQIQGCAFPCTIVATSLHVAGSVRCCFDPKFLVWYNRTILIMNAFGHYGSISCRFFDNWTWIKYYRWPLYI